MYTTQGIATLDFNPYSTSVDRTGYTASNATFVTPQCSDCHTPLDIDLGLFCGQCGKDNATVKLALHIVPSHRLSLRIWQLASMLD